VTLDGVREGKGEGMGCRKKKSGIVVRMRSMKHSAAGAVEKIDNLAKKSSGDMAGGHSRNGESRFILQQAIRGSRGTPQIIR
jgi:hypothetical protein